MITWHAVVILLLGSFHKVTPDPSPLYLEGEDLLILETMNPNGTFMIER